MKNIFIISLFFILSGALRAQVPHIDYMIADEAKSQLQIHGTFGPDNTGGALIEGVPCSVRYWSDTMVICDLPDSGAGSGGHVTVQQMTGTSNARMLSIFQMVIDHPLWYLYGHPDGTFDHLYLFLVRWYVNWRVDIGSVGTRRSFLIPFEVSKSSYGWLRHNGYGNGLDGFPPWSDSLVRKDSSITLTGFMDMKNYKIIFNGAYMYATTTMTGNVPTLSYHPLPISFDTLGAIIGYIDSLTTFNSQKADSLFNQKILFPPAIKNSVAQIPQVSASDLIKVLSHFGSEDHLISLLAEKPLGETTASLYSIDGRLLKQEEINISSAGMYSLDASGINARVGFLVLKTEKGIVAKKVMF